MIIAANQLPLMEWNVPARGSSDICHHKFITHELRLLCDHDMDIQKIIARENNLN